MQLIEQGKKIVDDVKLGQVIIYGIIIETILVIINYIYKEKDIVAINNFADANDFENIILINNVDDYITTQNDYVSNPKNLYVYNRILESLPSDNLKQALENTKNNNVTCIVNKLPTFGSLLSPVYTKTINDRYIYINNDEFIIYNFSDSRYIILLCAYVLLYMYASSEYTVLPPKLDELIIYIEKLFIDPSGKKIENQQTNTQNIVLSDTTLNTSNNQYDVISLICVVANTTWSVTSAPQSQGLTIV